VEVGQFRKRCQTLLEGLTVKHPSDVMCGERRSFSTASQRELAENSVHNASGDFSKSVAVKEEERSGAMTLQKEIEGFSER